MWKDSGNHALGSQKRPTGPWMVPSANGVRVHTQRTAVVRVVLSCTSCKMGVRRLLTFRVQRCPRHHIRGCPRSVVYHHFCNSRWVLLSRFQGSPPDSEVLSCHSPLGCRSWSWSWSLSPGGSGDRDHAALSIWTEVKTYRSVLSSSEPPAYWSFLFVLPRVILESAQSAFVRTCVGNRAWQHSLCGW